MLNLFLFLFMGSARYVLGDCADFFVRDNTGMYFGTGCNSGVCGPEFIRGASCPSAEPAILSYIKVALSLTSVPTCYGSGLFLQTISQNCNAVVSYLTKQTRACAATDHRDRLVQGGAPSC